MSRNHRKNIIRNYIFGRETESFVTDSIDEINRLSLRSSADGEAEDGEPPNIAPKDED